MADATTTHLTEQNFDEALVSHSGVLMGRLLGGMVRSLPGDRARSGRDVKESSGRVALAKVNVDENPGLARATGIRSIRRFFSSRKGKVADHSSAVRRKPI